MNENERTIRLNEMKRDNECMNQSTSLMRHRAEIISHYARLTRPTAKERRKGNGMERGEISTCIIHSIHYQCVCGALINTIRIKHVYIIYMWKLI